MTALPELQDRWKHLYHEHLPALAKARDSVQPKWPVYLDHCFARIVLDNAVGKTKPWTAVIKAPAIKNMTEDQLKDAIELAEKLATGEADLVDLDERSLELRGKKSKKRKGAIENDSSATKKKIKAANDDIKTLPSRKARSKNETVSSYFLPAPSEDSVTRKSDSAAGSSPQVKSEPDLSHELQRIQSSNLTPFRKQTLALLLQIPPGRYSTYGALSDHISKTSHKTCARAVGSSMRNNPFAPEVPCHRILAGDGSLGGFGGDWGEEGKHAKKKHDLLREEGVRFDSKGKAKGPPFRDFT